MRGAFLAALAVAQLSGFAHAEDNGGVGDGLDGLPLGQCLNPRLAHRRFTQIRRTMGIHLDLNHELHVDLHVDALQDIGIHLDLAGGGPSPPPPPPPPTATGGGLPVPNDDGFGGVSPLGSLPRGPFDYLFDLTPFSLPPGGAQGGGLFGRRSFKDASVVEQLQRRKTQGDGRHGSHKQEKRDGNANAAPKAQDYAVPVDVPKIPVKLPPSFAGTTPYSDKNVDEESYFWWFFPNKKSDSLVIWFNGGPGCSSLTGLLQEHGPVLYKSVKEGFVKNPHSWHKEANIVYVDQPAGAGFARGPQNLRDQGDISRRLLLWLDRWLEIFPDMAQKKLYLVGESYAGMYISYLADAMLSGRQGKYRLRGAGLIDPTLSSAALETYLPVYDYVRRNNAWLRIEPKALETLKRASDECGYTDFIAKNLKYPAQGALPPIDVSGCKTFDYFQTAALFSNPAFSYYKADRKQVPDDPLTVKDDPTKSPQNLFLDDPDVRKALHAPTLADVNRFQMCSTNSPFQPDADGSPPPADSGVLSRVIDGLPDGVFVTGGGMDALIFADAHLVTFQNMTWGGTQGFSRPPTTPFVVDGQKVGSYALERKLAYFLLPKAGHMVPADEPAAGRKLLRMLIKGEFGKK